MTAGAAIITGCCVTRAKIVQARKMRQALATAKAQTSFPVLGGYLNHIPSITDDGRATYRGGIIIDRDGTRDVLPFSFNDTTGQIKRTITFG